MGLLKTPFNISDSFASLIDASYLLDGDNGKLNGAAGRRGKIQCRRAKSSEAQKLRIASIHEPAEITVPMTTQVYAKTIVVSIWNNTPEIRQRQTSDCDILGIKADLWSEIGPRKAKGSWKFST